MDSLQEAFIHPPGTVRVLYFKSFEQDPANTRVVTL